MNRGAKAKPHGQTDPFLAALVTYADANGTITRTAADMGVSRTTFTQFRRGRNPTWETIRAMLDALGLDVEIRLK